MTNTSNKRKSISKKTRFEVFKRDKFSCQFCGEEAPKVVLEIDHILPVSKGGDNSLVNLVTACFNCNRGKGAKKLNDSSEVSKQKKSLDDLQERANQMKMLAEWRRELKKLDDMFCKECLKIINDYSGLDYELANFGKNNLLKLRKKYKDSEIFEVCQISITQYYNFPDDKEEQSDQWNKAFNYIPKILSVRKKSADNPNLKKIFYCRAILRNKSNYINESYVLEFIKDLVDEGYDMEDLINTSIKCYNWKDFERTFID